LAFLGRKRAPEEAKKVAKQNSACPQNLTALRFEMGRSTLKNVA
jgi:hypothetical protein